MDEQQTCDAYEPCPCGYRRQDKIVIPKARYTGLRWVSLAIGVTPTPSKIEFLCPVCGHIFETTTEPKALAHYKYGSA